MGLVPIPAAPAELVVAWRAPIPAADLEASPAGGPGAVESLGELGGIEVVGRLAHCQTSDSTCRCS